jgi:hypothetical protein
LTISSEGGQDATVPAAPGEVQRIDDRLDSRKEETAMYMTEVIWWGYTIYLVALALFMLYFAAKVRQTGPEPKRRKGG